MPPAPLWPPTASWFPSSSSRRVAEELQHLLERDVHQMSQVFKTQRRNTARESSEGMKALTSGTERSQHGRLDQRDLSVDVWNRDPSTDVWTREISARTSGPERSQRGRLELRALSADVWNREISALTSGRERYQH